MKITVFTSNQPRHISLIEGLASIADEVFAIQECNTVFPGQVNDFFKRTNIMQEYFAHVISAEKIIFGDLRFVPENVRSISLKSGDLNKLDCKVLSRAFDSDFYIIFGSSFIKGSLCDFLVAKNALNIHMGISPYYRGSSCNFWALYDQKPDYVGATIHLLSKGLDSGPILFHAIPKAQAVDPFVLGMMAVRSAHRGIISAIRDKEIFKMESVSQNKGLEIRYTRNSDFNDEIASKYLSAPPSPAEIYAALESRNSNLLLRPYIDV